MFCNEVVDDLVGQLSSCNSNLGAQVALDIVNLIPVVFLGGNEDLVEGDGVLVFVVLVEVDSLVFGIVHPQLGVEELQVVNIESTEERALGLVVLNHGFVQILHQENLPDVSEGAEQVENLLGRIKVSFQIGNQDHFRGLDLALKGIFLLLFLEAFPIQELRSFGETRFPALLVRVFFLEIQLDSLSRIVSDFPEGVGALTFHQLLEGLRLGSLLSQLDIGQAWGRNYEI